MILHSFSYFNSGEICQGLYMASLPKLPSLREVFSNKYLSSVVSLFLVLYAGMARPQLPPFINGLFDNAVFRLAVLSMVVFMGGHNVELSLMVAIAFTVTMNLLNEQKIAEGFLDGVRENMINERFVDNTDAIDFDDDE